MQTDIEIYLHQTPTSQICQWLQGVFGVQPDRQDSSSNKHTARFRIVVGEVVIPVLLVYQGAWTSVWFDSAYTPWDTDLDCAQDAVVKLGCVARCTDGGWQEGDEPDQFLEVTDDGVSTVIWRDG